LKALEAGSDDVLLDSIRALIKETRAQVATAVNAGLTLLYWRIGKRINEEILDRNRAEYGAQIVSATGRQLSWTHFKSIIYLDDSLKRDFYAEMCRVEGWSTRILQKKDRLHAL
jgi:hypothetical protein